LLHPRNLKGCCSQSLATTCIKWQRRIELLKM
jgi:hypothetical protein